MIDTLKYCKVREVKSPCRAHSTDAGIDFFVPTSLTIDDMQSKCDVTKDDVTIETKDGKITKFILEPGQSVLIPSGIKVKVPDGYALIYNNKSGVAAKKHLIVGSSVVDIGYTGECHINIHNVSTRAQEICAGDKIVQAILFKIGFHAPEEVEDELALYGGESSDRGAGGFGSSGTK